MPTNMRQSPGKPARKPRTPLARPGQAAASLRTAGSGLRLVHGGVRYAGSEANQGAARRVARLTKAISKRPPSPEDHALSEDAIGASTLTFTRHSTLIH